jgi:hypothetical protein
VVGIDLDRRIPPISYDHDASSLTNKRGPGGPSGIRALGDEKPDPRREAVVALRLGAMLIAFRGWSAAVRACSISAMLGIGAAIPAPGPRRPSGRRRRWIR